MDSISLGREPLGDKTGVVAHAALLWRVFATNNVPFIVGAVCDRAVIDRAYSYVCVVRHLFCQSGEFPLKSNRQESKLRANIRPERLLQQDRHQQSRVQSTRHASQCRH